MKKISRKIKQFIISHKIRSMIFLVILIGFFYFLYGKFFSPENPTKYVLARAERGDVVVSVTGTGQVLASDQVDIKSKNSGEIVWVGTKDGDEVKAGQALFRLDDTDIKKNILNTEISLREAKLQLEQSIVQAPIDYQKALRALSDAKENLSTEYINAFNTISDVYLKMPAVMTTLEDVLYGTELSENSGQWNVNIYKGLFANEKNRDTVALFSDIAIKDYKDARKLYDDAFARFKTFSRTSSNDDVESFLNVTYTMADAVSRATKSEKNLIDTVIDIATQENRTVRSYIPSQQANLNAHISTTNNIFSSLLNQKNLLKKAKDSVDDAQHTITLLQINNPTGDNPISLQAQKNNIAKQESDLADLKSKLAEYTVYAPFSGIIAVVNVKKGDTISNGTSLATLMTKGKVADISLNEIDAAKTKVGQKATLTFDALDGLSIVGEVISIDTVGTVSQGVVSYKVKIAFESNDSRIKPGMSVNAAIITDISRNVIIVPNAAVKNQGDSLYVEVAQNVVSSTTALSSQGIELATPPKKQIIKIGLANDSYTEITEGVDEGTYVVTRTILPQTTTASTQTPSLLSNIGGRTGGGTLRMR